MDLTLEMAESLRRAGAALGDLAGRRAVLHFGDRDGEYAALVGGVGLVCADSAARVELTGDDRAGLINRLATNKLDDLPPGSGRETFLCDPTGHVVAYGYALIEADRIWLHSAPGQADAILSHLGRYILTDQVETADRTGDFCELLLAGPEAEGLLAPLTDVPLPDEHLGHVRGRLAGTPVSVCRLAESEPAALLVSGEQAEAANVWRTLAGAGARPCGQLAAEAVRIEANRPLYARDVTQENLPQEVGRDALAISLTKGCYLGQETVARIDSRGHVNRMLVGLKFETAAVPPARTELSREEKSAGRVTSAAYSPHFGAAIGLGYVRRGTAEPGTALESDAGPAVVLALPVVRSG